MQPDPAIPDDADAGPAAPPPRPAPDGRLLLVRHGRGRGRIPRYMDRPLAFLADREPELRARIRVHETGTGAPPELEDVRAMAFFLADPLAERYPRCHDEATALADRAREADLPVLNPPDRLSNTRKSRQARLWRAAGLPTPPCREVRNRDDLAAAADAFGLPLLVRAELGHAQHGLRVLTTTRELEGFDPGGAWLAASPLVDVRAGYGEAGGWERRVGHTELWRRHHHKKRVYVVGEELVPFHLFFSDRPAVSLAASLYGPWRGWLLGAGHVPWPLSSLALLSEEIRAAIEEEKRFCRESPEVPDLLRRAVRTLGLDYAAVDYATRADGRPVLWEANAHPADLTPAHVPLRRERGAVDRVETLYRAIGALFRRLVAGERPPSAGARAPGADGASGTP